jgi:NADPH:quinone reductase-like Zn-dependent oxidoreductase
MGFGLRKPKTRVIGWGVAGSVDAVAEDVAQFQPGDEVFGTCRGAFAEYACACAETVALKPANLSFQQAAGGGRCSRLRKHRGCAVCVTRAGFGPGRRW